MKIYTKTGDQGETGLLGGKRVSKTHPCVEVCGGLDELNSWLGAIRSKLPQGVIESGLRPVQNDLFCIGTTVAGCMGETRKQARVAETRIGELESWMDALDAQLPPLTAFVLPGVTELASWAHLARNICRRVERQLVGLIEKVGAIESESKLDYFQTELTYLNRLSDLLFLLARTLNVEAGHDEVHWIP